MNLVQSLPTGPLDIVGDIHGEYDALIQLLHYLGYDQNGQHSKGRSLVFVGDYCDRGPDSPAVLSYVQHLVETGRAVAILGNHEINLMREDPKDGSGWFFDERVERDQPKYAPFRRPNVEEKKNIIAFLSTLPIALERDDLRVVHAVWQTDKIEAASRIPAEKLREHYDLFEEAAEHHASATALDQRMRAEIDSWGHGLEDPALKPPYMRAIAEHEANKQMMNPLKVLTSGVEMPGTDPFYSSGKWRFAHRQAWWNYYDDVIPVVVGHYWRRLHKIDRNTIGKGDIDLFESTQPFSWHGKRHNVFCIDFSVGGRWTERKAGTTVGHHFKLAALRWPEKTLQFDDGTSITTENFNRGSK